jgi:Na+-driven multidrug efflux pump
MKAKLIQGSVTLGLVKLILPMIWGIFAIVGFSLADTYFVAQLGTKELAAMSFTFPVVAIIGSIAMGLGTGTASIIGRAIGEGNHYRVQRLTTDSLMLSLLIVTILALLGLTTINPLFTALGAGKEVLSFVQDYMSVWYGGIICLVVPIIGNNAMRASGNTAVPSLIMTVAAAVNVVLDPVFIFGWGPIPAHRGRFFTKSVIVE